MDLWILQYADTGDQVVGRAQGKSFQCYEGTFSLYLSCLVMTTIIRQRSRWLDVGYGYVSNDRKTRGERTDSHTDMRNPLVHDGSTNRITHPLQNITGPHARRSKEGWTWRYALWTHLVYEGEDALIFAYIWSLKNGLYTCLTSLNPIPFSEVSIAQTKMLGSCFLAI